MPIRTVPLVTGHYYHIYNRGVSGEPIFCSVHDYKYFLQAIEYYRFLSCPLKLSTFILLTNDKKHQLRDKGVDSLVENVFILAYVLMPNHFHILVKQEHDQGINKFMSKILNSYSRYFNTKYERVGPLFQGVFKSVRIDSEEQLIHTSRYIHINPVVSAITNTQSLKRYPWSSLSDYLQTRKSFIHTEHILEHFTETSYEKFVFDQIDYAKSLHEIKHIVLENELTP